MTMWTVTQTNRFRAAFAGAAEQQSKDALIIAQRTAKARSRCASRLRDSRGGCLHKSLSAFLVSKERLGKFTSTA